MNEEKEEKEEDQVRKMRGRRMCIGKRGIEYRGRGCTGGIGGLKETQ